MPTPASGGFVLSGTPGTPVPLSAVKLLVRRLRLQPRTSATGINVGNVYIGGATLTKNTGTTIFAVLSPEQTESREITALDNGLIDLSQWYMDADNAGDGVLVGYLLP